MSDFASWMAARDLGRVNSARDQRLARRNRAGRRGSVVLMFGLLALAGCQSTEQQAQSHYAHGVELLKQGDLVKASLEFRQALQLKPDLVQATYSLGTILEQQQQFDGAAADFRDVAERDPKNVDARVHLGRILLAANQLDTAQKYSDEAYALAGTDPAVLALKAAVALKLGDSFDSIKYGEAALSTDPHNVDALMVLAAGRLAANDPAAAIQFLDQAGDTEDRNGALQLFRIAALQALGDDAGIETVFKKLVANYPQDSNLRDSLARWYLSKGRKSDAEQALRDFATANPKNTQAALALVNFVRSERGSDAARSELQARINQPGDTFIFRQALAQLSFADGKYADAVNLLNQLIASATTPANKTAAQVNLAQMMLTQKDLNGAGKLADAVLGADAKNVDGLSIRAAVRSSAGKYDDAVNDLRAALNQSPDSSSLHLQLADTYERSNKVDLAEGEYAKALQTDPANPTPALVYAQYLLRYGRADQADQVLTSFSARVTNNAAVLTLLAQLKLNKGDWIGAQQVGDALKKLQDSSTQGNADQILAAAMVGQKQYDQGIQLLQSAVASSDANASPLALLVRTYALAGKQATAVDFLKSLLQSDPKNTTAHVLLGALYALNKQAVEAEAEYRAAIDADPNATAGYEAMAQYLASTSRLGEAETFARQGVQHQPNDANQQLLLALILEAEDKYNDAIAVYQGMFAANPLATIPANNLASLLSDYRGDPASLDQAFQIASRFRTSNIPQFQDTLGWIYYLKGDYPQAITLLKTAADQLPGVGAVQYHLGMAYVALGQTTQAVASLQKASADAKTQTFPQQDKAQAELAQLTVHP